ncbi:MAG: 50S ribosomal protein L39e [Candidatus Altiarchaeota archaeon]|nr:50S ribosomal protein L39e [Candidatus Altiarchaeota archaeon]
MSSHKDVETKVILQKVHKTSSRAPVWVFAATNRRVRFSPRSRRNWRNSSIF